MANIIFLLLIIFFISPSFALAQGLCSPIKIEKVTRIGIIPSRELLPMPGRIIYTRIYFGQRFTLELKDYYPAERIDIFLKNDPATAYCGVFFKTLSKQAESVISMNDGKNFKHCSYEDHDWTTVGLKKENNLIILEQAALNKCTSFFLEREIQSQDGLSWQLVPNSYHYSYIQQGQEIKNNGLPPNVSQTCLLVNTKSHCADLPLDQKKLTIEPY